MGGSHEPQEIAFAYNCLNSNIFEVLIRKETTKTDTAKDSKL